MNRSKSELMMIAASRLADISDVLVDIEGMVFDPEVDMPSPDVRKRIFEMNPDPATHARIANAMLMTSGMSNGQLKMYLHKLERIGSVDIEQIAGAVRRHIENNDDERDQLYSVIRDAQRAESERAEQEASRTPEALEARIAELEKQTRGGK